jgi:predicted  nucleic acid-binding Zn-ribbon protein
MAKVNPEQLEAEAQEMIARVKGQAEAPPEEDTHEPEPAIEAQAPEEPTDTAGEPVEAPVEDERGELSETELALKKADERYKNAQRKMTQATTEAKELRRLHEQTMAELGELKRQLAEKDVDLEKLKQVREEYPDLAAPILDQMERTQAQVAETNAELEQLRQMRNQEAHAKAQEQHMALIREAHPDLDNIVESGDWADWLEIQNDDMHRYAERGSAPEVIYLLNKFKGDMGFGQPTPQERALEKAKAAAEPKLPKSRKPDTGAGQKVWSAADIKRMSLQDFEANQDALMDAWRQGQIRR